MPTNTFIADIPDHTSCICAGCNGRWSADRLVPITDAGRRLTPNAPVPAGQCEDCGALAYVEHTDRALPAATACEDMARDLQRALADVDASDAETLCRAAGWRHGGDFEGFIYDGKQFGTWKEAASADDATTYATWGDVVDDVGREELEAQGVAVTQAVRAAGWQLADGLWTHKDTRGGNRASYRTAAECHHHEI